MAKLQGDERSYQVLADLNTRPRTKYVAAVTNPNPELEEAPVEHEPVKREEVKSELAEHDGKQRSEARPTTR